MPDPKFVNMKCTCGHDLSARMIVREELTVSVQSTCPMCSAACMVVMREDVSRHKGELTQKWAITAGEITEVGLIKTPQPEEEGEEKGGTEEDSRFCLLICPANHLGQSLTTPA